MAVVICGVVFAGATTAPTAISDLRGQISNLKDTTSNEVVPLNRAFAHQALSDSVRQDPISPKIDSDTTISAPSRGERTIATPSSTDTTARKSSERFLDSPIEGTSRDSLIFDAKNNLVYIYGEGDVKYQTMEMKADYMRMGMESRELFAKGLPDSVGVLSEPQFTDGGTTYTMDSINYNTRSSKAKIYGVASQQGEGFLLGDNVKRMADNSIHMSGGAYTTCDHIDHPHFYLRLTKGKVIPGEKIIVGYSYLVMEDVPIYFPGIPEAFFPVTTERSSGILMPSWGEEYSKGFYLRDGGYYFVLGDHADLTLRGGIYTLGSWELSAGSNYTKRYKYRGSLEGRYSKDYIPEEVNTSSYSLRWTHSQDPKANPGQTFSASVNFSTSSYNRYATQNLSDYLNTQTSSSIAYTKTWAGTPFSLSANLSQSQNSQQKSMQFGLPNIVLNMSKIFPFKRSEAVGKERWYEKFSVSYTGSLQNRTNFQEDMYQTDKFGQVILNEGGDSLKYDIWDQLLDNMQNGIQHVVPLSLPLNLLGYINVSLSGNYTERWYFQRTLQEWDPDLRKLIASDPEWGFFRVYNYNFSLSASTKVYGDIRFRSPTSYVQAIRHTLSPSIGLSYQPDFSDPSFGFFRTVQSDSLGNTTLYSPYQNGVYGTAPRGQSGSLNFSLGQTLEAKVLSDADTSGMKKISIIDNLQLSGSYNFLVDSLNLSTISASLRLKLPFLGNASGFNISGTFDPYRVDKRTGRRINSFYGFKGGLARLTNTSWSFGHTFKGGGERNNGTALNELPHGAPNVGMSGGVDPYLFDPDNPMDPVTRRQLMTGGYYDFNVPWSFGINYSVSYTNNGVRKSINQTLGFNGNINLTQRFGITITGGFDFTTMQLTPGTVSLVADLHCWQMSFNWVPIGFRRQWSFSIHVKSAMLRDLKYEQNSSYLDNIFDQ